MHINPPPVEGIICLSGLYGCVTALSARLCVNQDNLRTDVLRAIDGQVDAPPGGGGGSGETARSQRAGSTSGAEGGSGRAAAAAIGEDLLWALSEAVTKSVSAAVGSRVEMIVEVCGGGVAGMPHLMSHSVKYLSATSHGRIQ